MQVYTTTKFAKIFYLGSDKQFLGELKKCSAQNRYSSYASAKYLW